MIRSIWKSSATAAFWGHDDDDYEDEDEGAEGDDEKEEVKVEIVGEI